MQRIPTRIMQLAPAFLKLLMDQELPNTANLEAPASVMQDSTEHILEGGILGTLRAYLEPASDGPDRLHPWTLEDDPLRCTGKMDCRLFIKDRFLKRKNDGKDVGLSAYVSMMKRLKYREVNRMVDTPNGPQKHVTGWCIEEDEDGVVVQHYLCYNEAHD